MSTPRFWTVTCGWYVPISRRVLQDRETRSDVAHVDITRDLARALRIFHAWQEEDRYDYVALHAPLA